MGRANQPANKALSVFAPVIFFVVVLLAIASIVAGWPHQFGGRGAKSSVLADFMTSGTATAPPLIVLVIFGAIAFSVRRRDRWGTVALILLLPLAALMAVGSLGEGLAPSTPDVPRAVQFLSGGFGTIAALVLAGLTVVGLIELRRARP